MKQLYVKTRAQWRKWLTANQHNSDGVWLVFYKKHAGKATLEYDEAVEEALCFGWIDSIIKKRDAESYLRKLTPRKPDSRWSPSNKKRVAKLTRQGLMSKSGLVKVKQAKKSGAWSNADRPVVSLEMPIELAQALNNSEIAKAFFEQLAPSYQQQFIGWINVAKRPETKQRRIEESISLLKQGKRLGLK